MPSAGDGTRVDHPPPPPLRPLTGAPRLGVLGWLGAALCDEADSVWSVGPGGLEEAAGALEAGADLVVGAWPGVESARRGEAGEVIGSPTPLGLVAARGARLSALGLPDLGPPDLVADDFAPWLLAACVIGRGGRVDLLGSGPPAPGVRVTGRGRAWLVRRGLAWVGGGVLDRDDWLRLCGASA